MCNIFVIFQLGHQFLYVCWTILWTIYHGIWLILEGYWWSQKGYNIGSWLTHFTNICYLVLSIMTFLQLGVAIYTHIISRDIMEGKDWLWLHLIRSGIKHQNFPCLKLNLRSVINLWLDDYRHSSYQKSKC